MLVSGEHEMIYTANYGGSSFSTLRLGAGGEVIFLLLMIILMLLVILVMLLVMLMMAVRPIFSLKLIKVGDVVSVENFPAEGETCRDASHPHQTVVKGILRRIYL